MQTTYSDDLCRENMDLETRHLMSLKWIFQGSTYELHKIPKPFNKAAQAAATDDSYLAEINSEKENNAVFKKLSSLISTEEFDLTTSQDGGGSAYVWIGGSDQEREGNWQWINSKQTISLSRGEWGRGALGSEPDGGTFQNGLGLGLENWPKGSSEDSGYGNAGSWNDINTSSALFYVTEKATPQEATITEEIKVTQEQPAVPEDASNAKTLTIKAPKKYKKKFSDKITNFNPSTDTLEINTASFGINSSATFASGKNKKAVKKKLAKQDFDFLYDERKGGLYFNENGEENGFGDGGIIAILKGGPDLTSGNLEFI
tara:strand:- start:260 stop:1207 length:948 start_codon:yes stop_codon:yes gene_type:complete